MAATKRKNQANSPAPPRAAPTVKLNRQAGSLFSDSLGIYHLSRHGRPSFRESGPFPRPWELPCLVSRARITPHLDVSVRHPPSWAGLRDDERWRAGRGRSVPRVRNLNLGGLDGTWVGVSWRLRV